MKQPIILVGLCVFTLFACKKKESAVPQPTPEQAAQIESEYILPANNAAAPAVVNAAPQTRKPAAQSIAAQPIQERINGAIHAQLTIQLRMYMEKNGGRMPQSFEEFAFRNLDTVPMVPEGMKYAIDPVDKAVK